MKKLQVIRSTKEQTKYIESKHALSKKKKRLKTTI